MGSSCLSLLSTWAHRGLHPKPLCLSLHLLLAQSHEPGMRNEEQLLGMVEEVKNAPLLRTQAFSRRRAEGKSWPQVVLWPPQGTHIYIPWHRKRINKYNHKFLKDRAVGCTPLIPKPRPVWSTNIVPRQPGLLHRETVSINEWKKNPSWAVWKNQSTN